MPSEVTTQEGTVPVGAPPQQAPGPRGDIAYGSPLDAQRAAEEAAHAADPVSIFRGADWSDLPNYYCPLCNYASLDGDAAVLTHGLLQHPGAVLEDEVVRVKAERAAAQKAAEAEAAAKAKEAKAAAKAETTTDTEAKESTSG